MSSVAEKKVYVCPKCKSWFSCPANGLPSPCPNCKSKLFETDIAYDELSKKTREDRAVIKEEYINAHKTEIDNAANTSYPSDESESAGSGMFANIGGKIKAVATVFCWIGIIASIIFAIVLFSQDNRYVSTILPGILCLLLGPLLSWLSSIALYGFGELIETNQENNRLMTELLSEVRKQGK